MSGKQCNQMLRGIVVSPSLEQQETQFMMKSWRELHQVKKKNTSVFNEAWMTILEEYFGEGGKWIEKPMALHVAGLQLTTAEPSYGEDDKRYWSESSERNIFSHIWNK